MCDIFFTPRIFKVLFSELFFSKMAIKTILITEIITLKTHAFIKIADPENFVLPG